MSNGKKNKIVSEEYADLLIEYNGDYGILEEYGKGNYTTINFRHALVNLPTSEVASQISKLLDGASIPYCFGLLDTSSLEASGIQKIQNIPYLGLRGNGVLVGFVDTGIEYTHSVFKNTDNTTRIVSIWDQNIENESKWPLGIPYGTEYKREQINLALKSNNPLEIVPSTDENGHGTMLAGIAAGGENTKNDFMGVVPYAELVVVKLKPAKQFVKDFFIPEGVPCYQETDIAFGIKYLTEVAQRLERPIAICIGLGTTSGMHDGRGSLSTYLSFIGDTPGTGVVIAAGNEGASQGHYFGKIEKAEGYDTVELNVGKGETGFTMELWGYAPNIYSIDILSPTGEYIPRIPARLSESRKLNFLFENTVIFVDYKLLEYQSGGEMIMLRFQNPTEGIWKFKVYGSGSLKMEYHIWLPLETFLLSKTFFSQSNPETTITSPGNALYPITVTAYDHLNGSLYIKASKGYTGINLVKPDFAAPGVNVYCPTLNNTFGSRSGTSVAAAHTTGVAAMLLEWGIIKGNVPTMDTFEIKNMLIRGAKREPSISYPNKEWGYGILDVFNTFETFRNES